jgi:hypothetical protein
MKNLSSPILGEKDGIGFCQMNDQSGWKTGASGVLAIQCDQIVKLFDQKGYSKLRNCP